MGSGPGPLGPSRNDFHDCGQGSPNRYFFARSFRGVTEEGAKGVSCLVHTASRLKLLREARPHIDNHRIAMVALYLYAHRHPERVRYGHHRSWRCLIST